MPNFHPKPPKRKGRRRRLEAERPSRKKKRIGASACQPKQSGPISSAQTSTNDVQENSEETADIKEFNLQASDLAQWKTDVVEADGGECKLEESSNIAESFSIEQKPFSNENSHTDFVIIDMDVGERNVEGYSSAIKSEQQLSEQADFHTSVLNIEISNHSMNDMMLMKQSFTDTDTADDCGVLTDYSGIPTDVAGLLEFVQEKLKTLLPKKSIVVTTSQGVQVGWAACTELLVIQRSTFFAVDGRTVAGLHGKNLPSDHTFWQDVRQLPLTQSSAEDFIQNVAKAAMKLRSLEVCTGVEAFEQLWESASDCHVDFNPYFENRFTKTCRSNYCSLLVPSLKVKRCGACNKLWQSLRNRQKSRPATDLFSTPSKFKPHKYLNTLEKEKRLHSVSIEMEKVKRANRDLKEQLEKVKKIIRTQDVDVSKEMSDDLSAILNSPEAVDKPDDVQEMFFDEQVKQPPPRTDKLSSGIPE